MNRRMEPWIWFAVLAVSTLLAAIVPSSTARGRTTYTSGGE